MASRCSESAIDRTGGVLNIIEGYEELLADNGLDSLDALFAVPNDASLNKPGLAPWRERLRLTLTYDGAEQTFYLKRFRRPPRGARKEVTRSGAGASSVAGVEWVWMRRLASDGIPCTLPVAFGEELDGERELRSAVLTAEVPGQSLEQRANLGWPADRAVRRAIVDGVAGLVGRFHRLGYIHRDLYLSHLFCDGSAPSEVIVRMIDLQRVIRPNRLQRRWIVKDLASLNFSAPGDLYSRTDRIRWLTRYLGARKLDGEARRLVYRVMGKTWAIRRHERRRTARRKGHHEG